MYLVTCYVNRKLTSPPHVIIITSLQFTQKNRFCPADLFDKAEMKRPLHRKRQPRLCRMTPFRQESRVLLNDLLTQDFLQACSKFTSMRELISASKFQVSSKEDFENLPQKEWNQFIAQNTSFGTWQELLDEATYQWFKRCYEANQQHQQ